MPFPWVLDPVPDSIKDPEGWIDPRAMVSLVEDALALAVGANSVVPAGEGSYGLRTWYDQDSLGRSVTVSAGEWLTGFSETPRACLDGLAALPDRPADLAKCAQRSLRVRYITLRKKRMRRPGKLYLRITVSVRSATDAPVEAVMPRREVECLVSDFLEELKRGW